jgi:kinesin family member 2/24
MASTYFENIDFYRSLVAPALNEREPEKVADPTTILANEASDTAICARIRPLSEEEERLQHIPGVVEKGATKAFLFEPRKKFNGVLDATVSLHILLARVLAG